MSATKPLSIVSPLLTIALTLTLFPLCGTAQTASEALLYSENTVGGTARFAAMGGAFCSLGGDMSSLAYNPAGIAVFTKNQFTITPGLTLQNTQSSYNENTETNESQTMVMQNIGLEGTWKSKNKDNPWKSWSLGVAYNRMNNFNENITIQGYNSNSSILDAFTQAANGTNYSQLEQVDPFHAGPAWIVGALDTLSPSSNNQYFNVLNNSANPISSDPVLQTATINSNGSMGETDITFGGNYNDRLYLGASIGIVDVNYNSTFTYSETPQTVNNAFGLQSFEYQEFTSTSGAGVNFKFGAIYKIMDWLRVGAAIHTPTLLSLTDNYSTFMQANFVASSYDSNTAQSPSQSSPNQVTNYTLITPLQLIGGVSAVINNQGIISADYEYVDYATANINVSNATIPVNINSAISQDYMAASNLRLGFEWVLYPVSLRLGYDIYGNPYSSAAGNSSIRTTYSAGIGFKINNVFIDVAYTLLQYNENYYLYTLNTESPYSTNNTYVSNLIFTLGVNFDNNNNNHQRRRRAYYPPPPPPPGAY